jgi:hypothetical protein
MRSTPSLDRGRFVLPRDLTAAAVTAATLVVAILVLGWLAGGLMAGVWSPRAQAATVADGVVRLAAPSARDDAPRTAAHARVPESRSRPLPAARPTRARAEAAPVRPRARRAPRDRRTAPAKPSTPSPAVPAPAVTPAPTAAPTAAAPVPTPSSAATPSKTRTNSEVATQVPAAPWQRPDGSERSSAGEGDHRPWRPSGSDDGDGSRTGRPLGTRPRGHDRRGGIAPQPTPTPAPSPTPTGDQGDFDEQGGSDRGQGHGRGGRWGR